MKTALPLFLCVYFFSVAPAFGQENRIFNPYEIIRLAQNQRVENEQKYTFYQTKVYQKNQAFLDNVPFNILMISGSFLPKKEEVGQVFWSEKISNYKYNGNFDFKDTVLKYRAAGTLPITNQNTLKDLDLSLYHKKVRVREGNSRGFISPLAPNALSFYEYYAMDILYKNGQKIFVVKFAPKSKGSAALVGTMELYDSAFTVGNSSFSLTAERQLELLDSIYIEQSHSYENDVYQKDKQNIHYFLEIAGYKSSYFLEEKYEGFQYFRKDKRKGSLKIEHFSAGAVSDDQILPPEKFVLSEEENQLLKTDNLNPLFREEFSKADFLRRPFQPLQLFFKRYRVRFPRYSWDLAPLYHAPGYNTVEGIYLRYDAPLTFFPNGKEVLIKPTFRYGFSDRRFKLKVSTSYFFDLRRPKKVALEFGRSYQQFNSTNPLLPVLNTFYSLFLGQNFLKLFGKDFTKMSYGQEILNGLQTEVGLEMAKRFPVFNTTDFHLTGNTDNFTPNNPIANNVIDNQGFAVHPALTFDLNFSYQAFQLYKIVNGRKVNLPSRSPRFYGRFRQGIPLGKNFTNYSFAMLGTNFRTPLGTIGATRWDLSGGRFLHKKNLPFVDFKHFDGTQIFFLQSIGNQQGSIKQFSTLRYYGYSTNKAFVEAHMEHRFDGFLLSKFAPTRRMKIHSFFGINYLNNFEREQFLEFVLGFDNIFRGLRLEVAGGIDNFKAFTPSVRVGVDFNYRFYSRNKKS